MIANLTAALLATAIAIPVAAALTCAIAPSLWAVVAGVAVLALVPSV